MTEQKTSGKLSYDERLKEAEKALRESEDKYNALLESAYDAIFVADATTGLILECNSSAERLLGRPKAEIIGLHQSRLHPPEEVKRYSALFRQHIESGVEPNEIFFVLRSSGEKIPVDIRAKVIELGGKKIIQGNFRNITEQLRIKNDLQTALALHEKIMASVNDGIFTMDLDGVFTFANKQALQVTGYSPDELKGKHYATLFPAKYIDDGEKLFKSVIETSEKVENFPTKIVKKDGVIRTVNLNLSPLMEGGVVTNVVGTAEDITGRRRAEDELTRSKALLQSVLDNSTNVIYVKDIEGRYLLINSWYETLFHVTKERVVGKTDYDIFPRDMADAFRENDRKVIDKNGPMEFEEIAPHDDGSHTYVSMKFPIYDRYNEIYAVCGISTDITWRKASEEKISSNARILQTIASAQAHLIADADPSDVFSEIIETIRQLTGSVNGFIGEILYDDNGRACMERKLCSCCVNGNDSCQLFDGFVKGEGKFAGMNRLHDPVLNSGELALSDPVPDEGSVGSVFAALPFRKGNKLVGMVGLVRRNVAYAPEIINTLQPLLETCSTIVVEFRHEEEKKQNERSLEIAAQVFKSAEEGVLVSDKDGVILFVNPAFTTITGYTLEEAVGNTPAILRSHRHEKSYYKNLWGDLITTGRWKGEIWNRRKNGELYLQKMTITASRDEKGAITQYASVFHDITDQRKAEEEIEFRAYHDALTGLANRTLFKDRLTKAISSAHRDETIMAVMFLDIDNFKNVNDTHGHAVGDMLLKGVALRLHEVLREEDTVSRHSGDEFTVLVESIGNENDAVLIAQKINKTLAEPFTQKGSDLVVTASLGVSLYPSDGEDPETLIKHADTAMYHAKEKGKNNYQLFDREMNKRVAHRLTMENDLRGAIDKGELEVFYQPKVSVSDQIICGWESLVRWRKQDGSMVSPAEFIPLAEETGLIFQIDEFVVADACKTAKSWINKGLTKGEVSINFSARRLDRHDFPQFIEDNLKKVGLAPEYFCVEITESGVMADLEQAMDNLSAIRAMGVKISVDDFGTGYSSLSYLRMLPIDELKIDRSFIKNLDLSEEESAITSAIVKMAHTLKLKVVAEGVETKEQLDIIRSVDCDIVQGYYYSRPVPAEEMETLLKNGF